MMRMIAAEFAKLKRARMPMWSALIVFAAACLDLAVLPVLADPKTQAQMATAGGAFSQAIAAGMYRPSWANYLHIGVQGMSGSWGVLAFGLVTAYVFGREYKEGAAKTMLTLPIRREYAVVAKLIVVAAWCVCLGLLSVLLNGVAIAALGVAGFTWSAVLTSIGETMSVVGLLYLTLPLIAWLAVRGRGYLQPMLFSLAVMMVGNALDQTPASAYFPWNMPLDLVGASWYPIPAASVTPGSWAIAILVFALGVAALFRQIDLTDNVG